MRIASGAEALVARVLTPEGVAGFGFTLNLEAIVARDMAAWDALARARGVPLHALFGKGTRQRVQISAAAGANAIDPFEVGEVEEVRRRAASLEHATLLAPNAHPWEIGYCAALAATLSGEVRIAVRGDPPAASIEVSSAPGIGIDWSFEPGFGTLRWIP